MCQGLESSSILDWSHQHKLNNLWGGSKDENRKGRKRTETRDRVGKSAGSTTAAAVRHLFPSKCLSVPTTKVNRIFRPSPWASGVPLLIDPCLSRPGNVLTNAGPPWLLLGRQTLTLFFFFFFLSAWEKQANYYSAFTIRQMTPDSTQWQYEHLAEAAQLTKDRKQREGDQEKKIRVWPCHSASFNEALPPRISLNSTSPAGYQVFSIYERYCTSWP